VKEDIKKAGIAGDKEELRYLRDKENKLRDTENKLLDERKQLRELQASTPAGTH
jgi:hypothetical protein